MIFLRKYGAAATLDGIPLITRNAVDLKANPTLAAGDAKISKDGGAFANLATLPAVTPAGSKAVRISLSATEMQAARICLQLVDQDATKEWEDQVVLVETYGNASATHAVDLSDAVRLGLTALPNAAAEATGGLYTRGTGAGQINQAANGQIDARMVGSSAAGDPLASTVPGTYASGTAGAALGRIGSGQIVTQSIVAQNGDFVVYKGDDYNATDSRALDWTDASNVWPDLTSASVRFDAYTELGGSSAFGKAGSVVTASGSSKKVRLELTAAETGGLTGATSYDFEVVATLGSGRKATLVRGRMQVKGE